MNKQKAPDGGPSSQEVAARTIGGGGTAHIRGGSIADAERRAVGGRYEVTTTRGDGLPLAPDRAPDAHGGHYFTAEDREKYKHVHGYDKGLAPGYDPTLEMLGKDDERGMYEIREFTPTGSTPRLELVNRTHNDGAQAVVGTYAVDPSGNIVRLAPNTLALKAGWRWAAAGDINDRNSAEEDRRREEDERRKQQQPPPPPAPAPIQPASQETPEQRQAREQRDPVLTAERNGRSPSDAERLIEAGGQGVKAAAKAPQNAAVPQPSTSASADHSKDKK